jgi:hypothetical protein
MIYSDSASTKDDLTRFNELLDLHEQKLNSHSPALSLRKHALAVNLLIPDMSQFAVLNKLYAARFGIRPPVRVTLQANKKDLAMAVLATTDSEVVNLHVQSYSTWAPANIGPYSQANLIKNSGLLLLAG